MKILHIIPGSGGSFYCGNCLRDSKVIVALRNSNHETIKLPMYLPLFADEHDLSGDIPVFYGAISIYLKQVFPVFRKAPVWVDNLLNSKAMLKIASRFAGSTRAKGLEEMTVSMLLGEQGQQKEELEKMIDWVIDHCKPDIIHLSNALLLGLARRMTERMKVPVVCSLQDEDVWVDVMQPSFQKKVWELMAEDAKYVERFIAVSKYYADEMEKRMNLPADKISTLHIGVYPEDYDYMEAEKKPRNIGFVSRMCLENGVDILSEAFVLLKQKPGFEDVKLILTGGKTGDDKGVLHSIKELFKENGLRDQVEFHENFEEEGLREFFQKVSVLSVPVRNGEAFGIYLLEAMASGIPVIQPELGAFPEIVNPIQGGKTYTPNTPQMLADSLAEVLSDKELLKELSKNARAGVEKKFHLNSQVEKMIQVYQKTIDEFNPENHVAP